MRLCEEEALALGGPRPWRPATDLVAVLRQVQLGRCAQGFQGAY